MRTLNSTGSAIAHVLIVFVILGIFSAASFQIIGNITKSGETTASQIELENIKNKIKFLLGNSNLCKTRLIIPGFNPAPGAINHPQIKDEMGNIFLSDGKIINGFRYGVTLTAAPAGRQGLPYAPTTRYIGKVNITMTSTNIGRTFLSQTKPLNITVFIEGNPISFCSTQNLFTQILAPPGFPNAKSSVECLDVGGHPVEISKYKDSAGKFVSFSPSYLSCFIPASSIMPSGCAAIGKLMAQSQTNPGEGWSFDTVAQQQFIGIAAAGNVAYAEASYCF